MKKLLSSLILLISISTHGQNLPTLIDSNNQIIKHDGYTLSYNETHEQANWVFYIMKDSDLECETKAKRKNKFKADTSVYTGSASLKDYYRSGYDRGHLKASADESCDQQQMDETFYMSNMSPQSPSFNRGGWKKLENAVRKLTISNDSLYVYTGPLLKPSLRSIGTNQVSVPEFFYKVVYIFKNSEVKIIAFLMPNDKITDELNGYRIDLIELEKLVGIDFPDTN